MKMLSLYNCGRSITRALFNGFYSFHTATDTRLVGKSELDLRLVSASCGFPKDSKRFNVNLLNRGKFGDDACFIAKYKNANVLGVADGVGGWRSYGIDPSNFSYSIMQICERLATSGQFNPCFPTKMIAKSFYELKQNKRHIIGSSTVCVLILNFEDNTMYTANIGDSGFLVVRRGQMVLRSQEQVHYFNAPFQLSIPPPDHGADGVIMDRPESAHTASFPIMKGDLILLATDGLFDNLPDDAIVNHLAKLKNHNTETIQSAVNSIACEARRYAFDSKYASPFSKRARENGIDAIGGKPDDITVLLAAVCTGPDPHLKTVTSQECSKN